MPEQTCYAPRVQESLDAVLGALVGIVSNIQRLETYTKDLSSNMEEIKNIVKHYHDSHLHPIAHDGQENYNVPIGRALLPVPITPTDKLMNEYNTSYDSDGNGLIFGKDFYFKDTDELPRILKEFNRILEKQNKIQVTLTYDEYLNTIPNSDKVWTR